METPESRDTGMLVTRVALIHAAARIAQAVELCPRERVNETGQLQIQVHMPGQGFHLEAATFSGAVPHYPRKLSA